MVGADFMITAELSETLRMLFRQMWVNGAKCENWDLILNLHDQEDRDYFEMLARRNSLEKNIPIHT